MSNQPIPYPTAETSHSIRPAAAVYLDNISRVLLAAALSVVAIFAIALLFFAMPVWDDLIRATRPVELGWWGYMQHVYYRWQGRWASCGLETLVLPRVDISRFYVLLTGLVGTVDVIGIYVLCRWVTSRSSRKTSAYVAAGLLALLWAGMPSLGETVYWFTGAVENAMVYALAALLLIAVDRQSRRDLSIVSRIFIITTLSISAICICGFHELYGGMLLLCLMIAALAALFDPKINHTLWISGTIAAAIGLWIVVRAPGNAVRFATDGGPHARHFAFDLRVANSEARHFVPRWFFDPKLLAVSVWVILAPTLRNERIASRSASIVRWLALPAWIVMLTAGFFAPSWAFGAYMPPRTLSGVYIIFVIGWLTTLYLWAPFLWKRVGSTSQMIRSTAVIIFAISLLLLGNTPRAAHDFYRRILPWRQAIENRYAILRRSRGTDAIVPPLPPPPWILLNGEVSNDPGDYRNWGNVGYFHLRSLRLSPVHGQSPPPPLKPTRPPEE